MSTGGFMTPFVLSSSASSLSRTAPVIPLRSSGCCCSPAHRPVRTLSARWFGHEAGRLCPVGTAGLCDDGSNRSVTSTHTGRNSGRQQQRREAAAMATASRRGGCTVHCSSAARCSAVSCAAEQSDRLRRWLGRRCGHHRVADRRLFIAALHAMTESNRPAARPVHRSGMSAHRRARSAVHGCVCVRVCSVRLRVRARHVRFR